MLSWSFSAHVWDTNQSETQKIYQHDEIYAITLMYHVDIEMATIYFIQFIFFIEPQYGISVISYVFPK